MKSFITCGILCIISPIFWWFIFNVFEDPKTSDTGLVFACIGSWIISEILLILMMCFIVHHDEDKLKEFFE